MQTRFAFAPGYFLHKHLSLLLIDRLGDSDWFFNSDQKVGITTAIDKGLHLY